MRLFYKQLHVLLLLLMLGLVPKIALAQSPVSGTVTDEKKQPLPGVSLIIKGTTTDGDARFVLAASPTAVLVIHFIGSLPQEVTVGSQQTLCVTLQPDNKQLDEVVVTALGVKKEIRKIGYAVQELNGEDVTRARDPNSISGLTGKIAGLSVGPSAELLRAPNVLLRGNSVSLYVVDGFPSDTDTWNISPMILRPTPC